MGQQQQQQTGQQEVQVAQQQVLMRQALLQQAMHQHQQQIMAAMPSFSTSLPIPFNWQLMPGHPELLLVSAITSTGSVVQFPVPKFQAQSFPPQLTVATS